MAWIQTYTGKAFKPFEPTPEMIDLRDIAHALSMICRFNGHCRQFYSVAEHCVRMSEEVRPIVAIHALLHDAAEAYVSDVARPIKPHLPMFKAIEGKVMDVIYEHFNLQIDPAIEAEIKCADLGMLATERSQLMAIKAPEWDSLKGVPPYKITLECWSPDKAEACFLGRFLELHQRD